MTTREEVFYKLKDFIGNDGNGIMLWIPDTKEIFCVSIGTGDNLLPEDRVQGYDAYLYIQTYKYDDHEFVEYNGGEMMFKSDEEVYQDDICFAVCDALEFIYDTIPGFIPLQKFEH